MDPERTRHARGLFAGIAADYDRMGAVLSFGQDPRWRRFLVDRVNVPPGSRVLDVATGTGLVARELAARRFEVVGLDQSAAMIRHGVEAVAEHALEERIRFVAGQAQRLPFADDAFDALTFTYLLRYVDDPAATLRELTRVVRPGGVMASLEFHVPRDPWLHAGWLAYTRGVMPVIGGAVSRSWYETGRFLGPNISAFAERYPLPVQVRMWQEAGLRHVHTRRLMTGTAVVTWGVKRNAVTG
jgi:demethylmenaquinone methyltransferase / 2-methoxy-6-polyprenyl-1,4-benzoquinol methylase